MLFNEYKVSVKQDEYVLEIAIQHRAYREQYCIVHLQMEVGTFHIKCSYHSKTFIKKKKKNSKALTQVNLPSILASAPAVGVYLFPLFSFLGSLQSFRDPSVAEPLPGPVSGLGVCVGVGVGSPRVAIRPWPLW